MAQGEYFNLIIPNTPDEVDINVWKPYNLPFGYFKIGFLKIKVILGSLSYF